MRVALASLDTAAAECLCELLQEAEPEWQIEVEAPLDVIPLAGPCLWIIEPGGAMPFGLSHIPGPTAEHPPVRWAQLYFRIALDSLRRQAARGL